LAPTTTSTTTLAPTTTTTTTLAPTTTTTTTLPPTEFSEVEFTIEAPYSLIDTPENMTIYSNELKTEIASVTGSPYDSITLTNTRPGSIINTVRLETIYVELLQYIVQNGLFSITIDGVTYPAIASSFVILDNICFRKGTIILTPSGYKCIESLTIGDFVKTAQGHLVKIQYITSFIGRDNKCPLNLLHKGSLGTNKPVTDLYMSEGHAYCNNGIWCHMKCSSIAMKLDEDDIEYYNIVLDNYLENTLVASGVEVESLFKMKDLDMKWNCGKDNCKPVITRRK
jgi:hypothetical protein